MLKALSPFPSISTLLGGSKGRAFSIVVASEIVRLRVARRL